MQERAAIFSKVDFRSAYFTVNDLYFLQNKLLGVVSESVRSNYTAVTSGELKICIRYTECSEINRPNCGRRFRIENNIHRKRILKEIRACENWVWKRNFAECLVLSASCRDGGDLSTSVRTSGGHVSICCRSLPQVEQCAQIEDGQHYAACVSATWEAQLTFFSAEFRCIRSVRRQATYQKLFLAFEAKKHGSDKVDTDTCIKCAIASKRKALNWREVFSSHCGYLRDFLSDEHIILSVERGHILHRAVRKRRVQKMFTVFLSPRDADFLRAEEPASDRYMSENFYEDEKLECAKGGYGRELGFDKRHQVRDGIRLMDAPYLHAIPPPSPFSSLCHYVSQHLLILHGHRDISMLPWTSRPLRTSGTRLEATSRSGNYGRFRGVAAAALICFSLGKRGRGGLAVGLLAFRQGEPGSIPATSLPDFRNWEIGNRAGRCRWQAGFLGDLPFSPPLQSGAAPLSPCFTLFSSQDLVVKSRQNLSSQPLGIHQTSVCLHANHFAVCLRDAILTASCKCWSPTLHVSCDAIF
ncbi:hypothetical protein PR048_007825 [Dryococelus australis]|uniref:Uncharacterized protein n=1 Tax=Dryococelus australis TaxID=614101 RepID=A0ABQ9HWZ2_9NEOP|nr:hypothetical protein PR048_007825 [Dryococelus australis]